MASIRRAVLEGSWYPAGSAPLARAIEAYLDEARPDDSPRGRPLVAVVPHAGYAYSGPAAGRLYGLLRGLDYDRIFILAPNHRTHLQDIALPTVTGFETPLGTVPVDTETIEQLAACESFALDDRAHADEHAVEIQLPFLQTLFSSETPVVPMLVPQLSAGARSMARKVLAPYCDGRSLFVVSTDFTHYGSAFGYTPFSQDIPEQLEELDLGAVHCILAGDPDSLLAYGEKTGITMCGLHATALALGACRTAGSLGDTPEIGDNASLITYCRSADREGDYSHSVSYASVLLTTAPRPATSLSATEREFLAKLARETITAVAAGLAPPAPETLAAKRNFVLTEKLKEKRGAFVTLTRDGQLRGCIGYIEGVEPLVKAITANAASAAVRDPRFQPVTPEEVTRLHVEISALTPLRPVPGPEDIILGRHGILLQRGASRAVFLPQVATEQGWDLETTLAHLAMKAGLPPDGWRTDTEFLVFEAEIFD